MTQTIFSTGNEIFGISILKIVKSNVGPHHILDIMFCYGLRITVDLNEGDDVKKIGREMKEKVTIYRPSLMSSLEISGTFELVSRCFERAFDDGRGRITDIGSIQVNKITEIWEETFFSKLLERMGSISNLDENDIIEIVNKEYGISP
jgi:hypothetical protein